jgi:hypothetical protein
VLLYNGWRSSYDFIVCLQVVDEHWLDSLKEDTLGPMKLLMLDAGGGSGGG